MINEDNELEKINRTTTAGMVYNHDQENE